LHTKLTNEDKMDNKLERCLNKLYDFGYKDEGVMTLGQFLKKHHPIQKSISVQEYSEHRIHLEYVKLEKPKTDYMLWLDDRHGINVPKLVYDMLENVPER